MLSLPKVEGLSLPILGEGGGLVDVQLVMHVEEEDERWVVQLVTHVEEKEEEEEDERWVV